MIESHLCGVREIASELTKASADARKGAFRDAEQFWTVPAPTPAPDAMHCFWELRLLRAPKSDRYGNNQSFF